MRAGLSVIALLLLVTPAAAWTQWGGDEAHSRLWADAPALLDVRGNVTLLDDGIILDDGGPGLLDTAHGLTFLARTADGCRLYRGNGSTPIGEAMPCTEGRLVGYDEATDLLLGCIDGRVDGPLLRAWDAATGAERWTTGPSRPILDPQGLLPVDLITMGCRGAVLDGSLLYITFTDDAGNHTVEALGAATGARRWAMSVPATEFAASALPVDVPDSPVPLPVDPVATVGATAGFVPQAVTLTDTGLLVTGRFLDAGDSAGVPAAAWMGLDGTLHGTAMADTGDTQSDVLLPMSQHGASRGPLAAALLGNVLLVVDPARPNAVPIPVSAASFGADVLAAPGWTSEALVVPAEGSAFLFGADAGDPGRWSGHDAGRLQDVLLLHGGAALGLVTGAGENATSSLVRFDAHDGRTLHRAPLPLTAPEDLGGHLTPLRDGTLLAWSRDGAAVLLGPAADGPAITLSDAYPALGATIEVEVAVGDDETVLVAWGDGLVQEMDGSGRLAHGYGTPGQHTLVATAVAPDNTTRSSRTTVHVGGFPPEEPGLIEILFGPDNWEITVTVIGGIISGVGLIVGFVSAYRGRHRLELRLKALDRIGDQGRRDPFKAVRDLHAERQKLREQLAKGTLSDAQYTVLQNHAHDILETVRQRILGGFTGRVSDAFNHRLDMALRDGSIDPVEGEALMQSVDHEDLGDSDRERLRELVRSWQTLMADG